LYRLHCGKHGPTTYLGSEDIFADGVNTRFGNILYKLASAAAPDASRANPLQQVTRVGLPLTFPGDTHVTAGNNLYFQSLAFTPYGDLYGAGACKRPRYKP
jgi:hypothetical protein